MKKVILALAIVSVSFAACNEATKTEETPAADTATKVEAPAVVDTAAAAVVDTTKAAVVDTTKK